MTSTSNITIKKGTKPTPFCLKNLCHTTCYVVVVDELEVCNAITTAATAAAAIATVVAVAAAAPAAPEAAAEDPAAPALPLDAPADDDDEEEDCPNDGIASDITNTSVDIIFKIRIKLTPTFS